MGVVSYVLRLIASHHRCEKGHFAMARPLDEIGVDALSLAKIVVNLERRFGIDIGSGEALGWTTGADVVRSVEDKIRAKSFNVLAQWQLARVSTLGAVSSRVPRTS